MTSEEKTKETEEAQIKDEFTSSIEAAVDAAIEEDKKNRQALEKPIDNESEADLNEEVPLEEEASSESEEVQEVESPETEEVTESEGDEESTEEPEPISDELLEKAVKAGITIRTARRFPDAEALEEAISLIKPESSKSGDEPEAKVEKGEAQADPDDIEVLLGNININADEYDSDLVQTVEALKGAVSALHKQNKELQSQTSVSSFESSIANLDETAQKIVRDDPSKKELLKKKFDVLKAGYKASGENLSDSDVFKEASEMVLAGDIAKAKTQSKSAQAQKRSTQLITRPSGKSVQASGSAEEEAVKLLKEKFNI